MKVINISTAAFPRKKASHIQILQMCQALVKLGHKVLLITTGRDIPEFTSRLIIFEYMAAGRPIISSDLLVLRGGSSAGKEYNHGSTRGSFWT